MYVGAERFHSKGFWQAQMVEHGTLGTGEYSNCLFCYTIRRAVVRDWGGSLVRRAPLMSCILPIDSSRALYIMISRILSDSFSAAALNGVNTSTAGCGAPAFCIPRDCSHPRRRPHILP